MEKTDSTAVCQVHTNAKGSNVHACKFKLEFGLTNHTGTASHWTTVSPGIVLTWSPGRVRQYVNPVGLRAGLYL